MSVLVLGGTGFIGGPTVSRLLADGVETAVAHHGARPVAPGAASVVLDRGDPAAVLAAVRDLRIDTVIDLIAYTAADTLPLLDALSGQIARYVMVSSVDVYRNYEGLHRKGRPTPIWDRLTEDAALRASRFPYRLAKPRAAAIRKPGWTTTTRYPLKRRRAPPLGSRPPSCACRWCSGPATGSGGSRGRSGRWPRDGRAW
jgi:nucleoside-diphosphate-sugar epimerase